MALTAKQLRERTLYIGASDVPAIIGVDPYKTSYQIWLEKTGQYQPDSGDNPSLMAGSLMEDAVLRWAENQLGKISKRSLSRRIKGTPIKVHLDGSLVENGEPVEAKTAGLHGPVIEFYGEEGTDELPERVLVQCQMQMAATDANVCHVPVFIGGRGFVMYHVERDRELIDLCVEKACYFWNHHVKKQIAPPEPPPIKLAKFAKRQPGKSVEVPKEIIDEWLDIKAELAYVVERKEAVEQKIHQILIENEAEIGVTDHGELSYMASERKTIDTKLLKANEPEVADRYTKVTTTRTLRWKPKK